MTSYMGKAIVRNEHREAFREGKLEEIPKEALDILQKEQPAPAISAVTESPARRSKKDEG